MSFPAVWNHPSNLIGFCPKQTAVLCQLWQLSHDSCHSFSNSWDSFFMIAVTAFPDSWDNFLMIAITIFPDSWDGLFRTAVIADLVAWTLLIFPYLAKTKTNYWNYLSLAKIPSFSVTFSPTTLTRNSKNILKLNIPFLTKS